MRIPAALALALAVGALWWWAVLRLVLAPEESGAVEGAVAVGGWGLGLLPVHCVPEPVRKARRRRAAEAGPGVGEAEPADGVTTASRLPHSGEGSGPS
ncbi:hypothetical protein [Streptomyces sp. NPDC046685]|uniref:hypothetical protein n=1 Tax=Streptomyces sp. NPDC046685 TaxID=3157202 RepID=UPI003408E8BD